MPVPPPMPAVMNTMWQPARCALMSADGFFRRRRADVGLGAGAETFGDMDAHLDAALGARAQQSLRIGVGDHELDAAQAGGDHVVDGVAARSAHTKHGDPRLELGEIWNLEIDRHGSLLS